MDPVPDPPSGLEHFSSLNSNLAINLAPNLATSEVEIQIWQRQMKMKPKTLLRYLFANIWYLRYGAYQRKYD